MGDFNTLIGIIMRNALDLNTVRVYVASSMHKLFRRGAPTVPAIL